MARILVTGASGLLGLNFSQETLTAHEIFAVDRGKLVNAPFRILKSDLLTPNAVDSALDSVRPQWVVNCAALADLDACEDNPELARRLNVDLPAQFAKTCVGKGHRIAFNILNIGRLKLGVTCVDGARNAIALAVPYANDRKAFGKPISEFGLIREKVARMVAQVYVGEAMSYRTTGLIDQRIALSKAERGSAAFDADVIAAVEEYNIEASILKVWGSETLFQVADEVYMSGRYRVAGDLP